MRTGKIVATAVCLTTCLLNSGSILAERAQAPLLVTATVVQSCQSSTVVATLPDGTVVPQVTVDCGATTPYQVRVDSTTTTMSIGQTTRTKGANGQLTVTVDF